MRNSVLFLLLVLIACDVEPEPAPVVPSIEDTRPVRLTEAVHALEARRTGVDTKDADLFTCSPVGAFEGTTVRCTPASEIEALTLSWSLPEDAVKGEGPVFEFAMPAVCDVGFRFVPVRVEARDADGAIVTSDVVEVVAVNLFQ